MAGPVPHDWAVDPSTAGARLVVPGLWRLRLPMAWDGNGHANAFAVDHPDGPVLLDCGSAGHPANVEALEVALAQAGWRIEDVSLLVGTHTHSDHIGIAASVIERAGCPFWMHAASDSLYDGFRDPEGIESRRRRGALRAGVPESLLDDFADVGEETLAIEGAVLPDRTIGDGDEVATALGPWRVLETPGHAPSHVCLWQPERRLIAVGDLLCAAFAPWFDLGYSPDPYAEWQRSLDRIDELGPLALALPGHGRPLEDVAGAVEVFRHGMRRELDAVRGVLETEPQSPWRLAERSFGPLSGGLDAVWRMSCVLAYLRHLHVHGGAERIVDVDRVLYRTGG